MGSPVLEFVDSLWCVLRLLLCLDLGIAYSQPNPLLLPLKNRFQLRCTYIRSWPHFHLIYLNHPPTFIQISMLLYMSVFLLINLYNNYYICSFCCWLLSLNYYSAARASWHIAGRPRYQCSPRHVPHFQNRYHLVTLLDHSRHRDPYFDRKSL